MRVTAVDGIAVVSARIYVDIVCSQLKDDYAPMVAPLPVQLSAQAQVFSLRSQYTGRIMHWCVVPPAYIMATLEHLVQVSANVAVVFVFYPIRNIISNVNTALSWWMSPQYVAQMGDTRFWCISQSLAQRCLYWSGGSSTTTTTTDTTSRSSSNSNSDDDDIQFAAAQTASLQQQQQQQEGRKNQGLTARLSRTRRCEKALPNQPLCVICHTNRASTAFLDCGHVSACEDCIYEDCEKGTGRMVCYTCRAPCFLGVASLYVSENCTL